MISLVYNIVLTLFYPFYFFYRLLNKKFRLREQKSLEFLKNTESKSKSNRRIWFHSASMGEFEQAKPVIELIKKNHPEIEIFCSFYSPSGLENQKNYQFADRIFYLPFDFKMKTKKLISILKPDLVIIIRYEIWRNFLELLDKNNCPVLLINATFPSSSLLMLPILKKLAYSNYNFFKEIYTFNNIEYNKFIEAGLGKRIISSYDTRYDRIMEKVNSASSFNILPEEFISKREFCLVCGSTWEPDEDLIIEAYIKLKSIISISLIIIPHEPEPEHISRLQKLLPESQLLSNLKDDCKCSDVIIVDSIGKLLKLYKYANLVFVGGAFGAGIHSVAEPAGYGVPIICGPGFINSPDALELYKINALTVVKNSQELIDALKEITSDKSKLEQISSKTKNYIVNQLGSSKIISDSIIEILN